MTPYTDFLGKCPKCDGYDTRIRSEVITYPDRKASADESKKVKSASRVYVCNTCKHSWTEKIGEDK
jgi:predicted ATP-dependent serine protease